MDPLERIATALERIATAQEQLANDDPLSRLERAMQRLPEPERAPTGDLAAFTSAEEFDAAMRAGGATEADVERMLASFGKRDS